MVESFIFYEAFAEQLECLCDALQLKFYKAITRYGLYNEEPEFTGIEMLAWLSIQEAIDESKKETGKQRKVSQNNVIPPSKCPDPRECTKTVSWPW